MKEAASNQTRVCIYIFTYLVTLSVSLLDSHYPSLSLKRVGTGEHLCLLLSTTTENGAQWVPGAEGQTCLLFWWSLKAWEEQVESCEHWLKTLNFQQPGSH